MTSLWSFKYKQETKPSNRGNGLSARKTCSHLACSIPHAGPPPPDSTYTSTFVYLSTYVRVEGHIRLYCAYPTLSVAHGLKYLILTVLFC